MEYSLEDPTKLMQDLSDEMFDQMRYGYVRYQNAMDVFPSAQLEAARMLELDEVPSLDPFTQAVMLSIWLAVQRYSGHVKDTR